MKTRWGCKGSLPHERDTTAPAVDRSDGDWGKVAMPNGHLAQKEGIEAGEAISMDIERREACLVRIGRMKRMTRASIQGKL